MKTLGKLNINSEKIMKNEELVALRGGYGPCYCYTDCYMNLITWFYAEDYDDCYFMCQFHFNSGEAVYQDN